MQIIDKERKTVNYAVYGAPISRFRDPAHAQLLAVAHKSTAPTANLMIQRTMDRIIEFHKKGGKVYHDGAEVLFRGGSRAKGPMQELNVARMERAGEASVYDANGQRVFLALDFHSQLKKNAAMNSVPLVRMDDAWGANSRRTVNRFYEKIETPSERAVDRRLWSMMFWLDVSHQIMNLNKQ